MIRLLGGAAVLLAAVALGRLSAGRLDLHRRRLYGAEQGILLLAKEIDGLHTPLPQALSNAAGGSGHAAPLFQLAADTLYENACISGEEAFLLALQSTAGWWQDGEYAVLTAAAAGLGEQDAKTQVQRLELAAARFAAYEKEAAEAETRFGRLYRSMGWAGGAALVLLFL